MTIVLLKILSTNTQDNEQIDRAFSAASRSRARPPTPEPRRHIQVVAGARQVGKTTLVQQVTEDIIVPVRFASADEPTLRGADWIAQQWEAARLSSGHGGAILVLDEVHAVSQQSPRRLMLPRSPCLAGIC